MRRRDWRLAQATMRGMLLLGGVIVTWGAFDAAMDEPAYAVDEPRPGIVGNLLNSAAAVLDTALPSPSAAPTLPATVDHEPAGTDAVCEPACRNEATASTPAPSREPDPAVRVPTGELSRAVAPVTRPVVGVTASAVREIAGTGQLDAVDAVVRPVVEVLAPVLAPVLGVTQPILGLPTAPAVPPGDPVEQQPVPADPVPVTTTPGNIGHPALVPAATRTRPQAGPPAPARHVPVQAWSGGGSAAGAPAEVSRGPAYGATGTSGLTPIASGSATASTSAGAGAATAGDISARPWTPQLLSQSCTSSRCGTFADRSPQPGTRPA